MSYILEALRKAERERQTSRVPTLGAAHGDPDTSRRRAWPWSWAVVAALLLGAVVTYLAWTTGHPGPVEQSAAGGRNSPAVETRPAPASAPAPSAPSVGPAPERVAPAAQLAPPPTVAPPSGAVEPASPRAHMARATGPAAPRAAQVEAETRPAATLPRPGGSGETLRPVPIPEVPTTPPSAGLVGSAPSEARQSTALPMPAAVPSRPAQSAPVEPPRFTLDVLVYSDAPAERLVFINGRKYVEGQAVDGETVVEQITPDGAVLRNAERRIVLSPKLNPYTRPRSP